MNERLEKVIRSNGLIIVKRLFQTPKWAEQVKFCDGQNILCLNAFATASDLECTCSFS